ALTAICTLLRRSRLRDGPQRLSQRTRLGGSRVRQRADLIRCALCVIHGHDDAAEGRAGSEVDPHRGPAAMNGGEVRCPTGDAPHTVGGDPRDPGAGRADPSQGTPRVGVGAHAGHAGERDAHLASHGGGALHAAETDDELPGFDFQAGHGPRLPLDLKQTTRGADHAPMRGPTARRVAVPAVVSAVLLTGDAFAAGLNTRHGGVTDWLVVGLVALLGLVFAGLAIAAARGLVRRERALDDSGRELDELLQT